MPRVLCQGFYPGRTFRISEELVDRKEAVVLHNAGPSKKCTIKAGRKRHGWHHKAKQINRRKTRRSMRIVVWHVHVFSRAAEEPDKRKWKRLCSEWGTLFGAVSLLLFAGCKIYQTWQKRQDWMSLKNSRFMICFRQLKHFATRQLWKKKIVVLACTKKMLPYDRRQCFLGNILQARLSSDFFQICFWFYPALRDTAEARYVFFLGEQFCENK